MDVLFKYLYSFTAPNYLVGLFPEDKTPSFVLGVFIAADKYDVPALRKLAARALDARCWPQTGVDGFVSMIYEVDNCTINKQLWELIFSKVMDNMFILVKNDKFKSLLRDLPDFTCGLVEYIGTSPHTYEGAWGDDW